MNVTEPTPLVLPWVNPKSAEDAAGVPWGRGRGGGGGRPLHGAMQRQLRGAPAEQGETRTQEIWN